MHASSRTRGSTEIGFCTASHEVRPLFLVIIGLGEKPNPCRASCSALVPLQVPFLPILTSLHSCAPLQTFGLQVLAHWEGALGSTSTSGQRHTWRSQGRSPFHTTCREKQIGRSGSTHRVTWDRTHSFPPRKYRVTRTTQVDVKMVTTPNQGNPHVMPP